MAWMRSVGGRLKGDYQYSAGVIYNNFPWPENVTDAQRAQIEALAQGVLDADALYPDSSLADLYQRKPFASDADRVALLFKRYQALTS